MSASRIARPVAWRDLAPRPSYGMLTGTRHISHRGGAACPDPRRPAAVKPVGRFVAADAGSHVASSGDREGAPREATWSRGGLRWLCPRRRAWRQLGVKIGTAGDEPAALFVPPAAARAGAA